MNVIKFYFEVLIAFSACILSIAVALVPVIIYQVCGGSEPNVDLFLRCFGFCIWLLGFVYVMNRGD